MAVTGATDFAKLIDDRPMSALQWRVIVIAMTIVVLDGFDLQAIGVAAPALAREWGLTPKDLGPAFASAPFGMMLGAFVFGPLADRFGRRNLAVVATLLMGAGALGCALAGNLPQLIGARLLTGVGLGGVLPMLIALVTEYSPKRLRGTMMMLSFGVLPFGSMLAGMVGAPLVGQFGWHSLFIVGGLGPIVMALVALVALPESARYLVARGDRADEVRALVRRLWPREQVAPDAQYVVPEIAVQRASPRELFGPGRTACTLLLIAVFGMNMFMVNFSVNWLPTLFTTAGLPPSVAYGSATLLNLGGGIGAIMWGVAIDRFGPYRVMIGAGLASAASFVALAVGGLSPATLTPSLFVLGWCILGAMPGIYALIAGVYPTAIRSTGVGTVLGLGRIGSVVGPIVGGLLLAMQLSVANVFLVMLVPPLLLAAAVLALSKLPRGFG